ncbi:MAG: excinuclease ABC subunit C [Coxiella sp. RIFCSPHIGHO2_12_FULL_42_15]|nr:MAG: excinuclease ABC subunit C [Coxiella sp. RIFCSPHIGHO2_12_FULL_42_15]
MTTGKIFNPLFFIKNLSTQPGVYQMQNATGETIYVGKARNLQKRVASYFSRQLDTKTQVMVAKVANIEVIVTASENEALLLESNLIKSLKPRYNILLRDDKSYPYLYLSTSHSFPRLDFYRGAKQAEGEYFGPYPSAGSVRENLALIQKLFKLRQCRDSFFNHRTRPCLQYQIKRCTAPCVGLVTEKEYQKQVQHAIDFLHGKNNKIIEDLTAQMDLASEKLDYEMAAHFRDQIIQLRRLQQSQAVMGDNGNIDVIGVFQQVGKAAISVLQIRGGRLLGKRAYFPIMPPDTRDEEIIAAFIPQYYLNKIRAEDLPQSIVVSHALQDRLWIQQALQAQWQNEMTLSDRKLAKYRQWQKMAIMNATQALKQHLSEKSQVAAKLEALQHILQLPNPISRIECFDISHTQGEAAVASCVVFTEQGEVKKEYRKYNMKEITSGDDYAAMRQALLRRYTRVKSTQGSVLPDLLIIDGGKGQLAIAAEVLEELQVSGVWLLGVAKGPARKPGLETLWLFGKTEPVHLSADHLALHLIQLIRDEAHRFAITAHRAKRGKARQHSILEEIEGIGVVRRRRLLQHFGGLQELKKASAADIARVPGISDALAQQIFDALHGE